jgi:hypothetical protein
MLNQRLILCREWIYPFRFVSWTVGDADPYKKGAGVLPAPF